MEYLSQECAELRNKLIRSNNLLLASESKVVEYEAKYLATVESLALLKSENLHLLEKNVKLEKRAAEVEPLLKELAKCTVQLKFTNEIIDKYELQLKQYESSSVRDQKLNSQKPTTSDNSDSTPNSSNTNDEVNSNIHTTDEKKNTVYVDVDALMKAMEAQLLVCDEKFESNVTSQRKDEIKTVKNSPESSWESIMASKDSEISHYQTMFEASKYTILQLEKQIQISENNLIESKQHYQQLEGRYMDLESKYILICKSNDAETRSIQTDTSDLVSELPSIQTDMSSSSEFESRSHIIKILSAEISTISDKLQEKQDLINNLNNEIAIKEHSHQEISTELLNLQQIYEELLLKFHQSNDKIAELEERVRHCAELVVNQSIELQEKTNQLKLTEGSLKLEKCLPELVSRLSLQTQRATEEMYSQGNPNPQYVNEGDEALYLDESDLQVKLKMSEDRNNEKDLLIRELERKRDLEEMQHADLLSQLLRSSLRLESVESNMRENFFKFTFTEEQLQNDITACRHENSLLVTELKEARQRIKVLEEILQGMSAASSGDMLGRLAQIGRRLRGGGQKLSKTTTSNQTTLFGTPGGPGVAISHSKTTESATDSEDLNIILSNFEADVENLLAILNTAQHRESECMEKLNKCNESKKELENVVKDLEAQKSNLVTRNVDLQRELQERILAEQTRHESILEGSYQGTDVEGRNTFLEEKVRLMTHELKLREERIHLRNEQISSLEGIMQGYLEKLKINTNKLVEKEKRIQQLEEHVLFLKDKVETLYEAEERVRELQTSIRTHESHARETDLVTKDLQEKLCVAEKRIEDLRQQLADCEERLLEIETDQKAYDRSLSHMIPESLRVRMDTIDQELARRKREDLSSPYNLLLESKLPKQLSHGKDVETSFGDIDDRLKGYEDKPNREGGKHRTGGSSVLRRHSEDSDTDVTALSRGGDSKGREYLNGHLYAIRIETQLSNSQSLEAGASVMKHGSNDDDASSIGEVGHDMERLRGREGVTEEINERNGCDEPTADYKEMSITNTKESISSLFPMNDPPPQLKSAHKENPGDSMSGEGDESQIQVSIENNLLRVSQEIISDPINPTKRTKKSSKKSISKDLQQRKTKLPFLEFYTS